MPASTLVGGGVRGGEAGALLRVRSVGSGSEADPNVRLTAIERYTRTGELIDTLPLAIEDVRWVTISADGSKLAVNLVPGLERSSIAVISTADGSIIATIDDVAPALPLWVDGEVLISYSGEVLTLDGAVVGQMPRPPDVPFPGLAPPVVVGPATGLPASADHLRF